TDGDGSHGSTSKTPSYTKSVSWHHYQNWQQNALQALTSDKKGLTPEKLLVLQDHVLNYNVEVSLVGTLARKIVAAVETLTRS
ncbi:type III secretion system inner rod subunit SctI, partial [Escherichia coli]|uniref:type III secretion system inner rod subunit SctI n=1 Tax=Escherichia coli TaxID=562 RepID=UPI0032DBC925